MTRGPSLAEVQTLLWRLITAPEGVAAGAEALHAEGVLAGPDLRPLIRASATLSPEARLDVYADMYFYRLRDCLAEDFPRLARWIGAARFHNLATDYLLAHPSRSPSLRDLGRALPAFLAGHPLSRRFPLAPGLAALEWARVDVFDEADADPATRETLIGCAPERCRLALVPAARLVPLDAGVLPLWRRLGEESRAPEPAPTGDGDPGVACVWRRGFAVRHRSLAADEAHCLEALGREPSDLEALGERLLAAPGMPRDEPSAGRRLAELLGRWTADGLLHLVPPAPGC